MGKGGKLQKSSLLVGTVLQNLPSIFVCMALLPSLLEDLAAWLCSLLQSAWRLEIARPYCHTPIVQLPQRVRGLAYRNRSIFAICDCDAHRGPQKSLAISETLVGGGEMGRTTSTWSPRTTVQSPIVDLEGVFSACVALWVALVFLLALYSASNEMEVCLSSKTGQMSDPKPSGYEFLYGLSLLFCFLGGGSLDGRDLVSLWSQDAPLKGAGRPMDPATPPIFCFHDHGLCFGVMVFVFLGLWVRFVFPLGSNKFLFAFVCLQDPTLVSNILGILFSRCLVVFIRRGCVFSSPSAGETPTLSWLCFP